MDAAGQLDADLAGNGPFQETLDLLNRDAVDDGAEETLDNQILRFSTRDTARLQVEEVLLLDLGDGGAVRAAHVVRGDLQVRNRVGARCATEDEVAVLLVRIRLLCAFRDLDQARVHRACMPLECALELEIAGGVRRLMKLPGVVIEELIPIGKEDAQHLGQGVAAPQVRGDRRLGELRARA